MDDKYFHYQITLTLLYAHSSGTVTLAAIVTNSALYSISSLRLELLSWRVGQNLELV